MTESLKCSLCNRPARFKLRRIKTDQWLDTCATHDNFIGIENLKMLGHSREEAVKINREVKGIDGRSHKK